MEIGIADRIDERATVVGGHDWPLATSTNAVVDATKGSVRPPKEASVPGESRQGPSSSCPLGSRALRLGTPGRSLRPGGPQCARHRTMIGSGQTKSARGQSVWKSGLGLECSESGVRLQHSADRPETTPSTQTLSFGSEPIGRLCADRLLHERGPGGNRYPASIPPGGPMARRAGTNMLSSARSRIRHCRSYKSPRRKSSITNTGHGRQSLSPPSKQSRGPFFAGREALMF